MRRPPPSPTTRSTRTLELILPADPGVRSAIGSDVRAVLIGVGGAWRYAEVDADGEPQPHRPIDSARLRAVLAELVPLDSTAGTQ